METWIQGFTTYIGSGEDSISEAEVTCVCRFGTLQQADLLSLLVVDLGCVFIGHGLPRDFRTISTTTLSLPSLTSAAPDTFVPPECVVEPSPCTTGQRDIEGYPWDVWLVFN
jgi:hypothetical protein